MLPFVKTSSAVGLFLALGSAGAAVPLPALDQGQSFALNPVTGTVRFIGTEPGRRIAPPAARGIALDDVAAHFAERFGPAFGLDDPATELEQVRSRERAAGGRSVRYRQLHQGVPVIAGELRVNVDGQGNLMSMGGELAQELTLEVTPTLGVDQAEAIARGAVAKWYRLDPASLQVSGIELSVYDATLLKPSFLRPGLVWRFEVTAGPAAPVRELVLVNAHSGAIDLHFNQVDTALHLATHTADETDALPGTPVCDETDMNCSVGSSDAAAAHAFAADTYHYYFDVHGRDSFDALGGTLISTVHWDDGQTCPNAFWNGSQMAYCTGLPVDDVVAHELTHAVTDRESGLFYYYQSGAINESLSDLWGEIIDQQNGAGDDSAGVAWQMGEDMTVLPVLRNMSDPTLHDDPDRMTSGNYHLLASDNGGVHINSGINNKAVYLMVEGGSFNGVTVTAIGAEKTARVYYEAQTNLLLSGSDYADLYNILYQACSNLVGQNGITAADCTQVRNATDAVEMDQQPVADFTPEASLCPDSLTQDSVVFADDMESAGSWYWNLLAGSYDTGRYPPWQYVTGYATSGARSLLGADYSTTSDAVIYMSSAISLPASAYLHFTHAFGFDSATDYDGIYKHFDAGVVEYSTNGGTTWSDLSALHDGGQGYSGTVSAEYSNTLGGRSAFVDESHGYVSSRYDLTSLAGQGFQLRFRVASDDAYAGPIGWVIDDVQIYSCAATSDPSCSGDVVNISNRTFAAGTQTACVATTSITTGSNVVVENGATLTLRAPRVTAGAGLHARAGSSVVIQQ